MSTLSRKILIGQRKNKPGLHCGSTPGADRPLCRGRQRLLAVCSGVNMMLSEMMEGPCRGQDFPGGKSSAVLLRLSLRWWADIQLEMSARLVEMRASTCVSGWKRKVVKRGLMMLAILHTT